MTQSGACLCGAVTFEAQDIETEVHSCHCSMCRNWSGGPFFGSATSSVTFSGEDKIKRFASSEWAERGFCTECGSNLFYFFKAAGQYMLCQGLFKDQTPFKLTGEIYVDEKPAGYNFAGDHPRLTGAEFLASLGINPEA